MTLTKGTAILALTMVGLVACVSLVLVNQIDWQPVESASQPPQPDPVQTRPPSRLERVAQGQSIEPHVPRDPLSAPMKDVDGFAIDRFEPRNFHEQVALRLAKLYAQDTELPIVREKLGDVGLLKGEFQVSGPYGQNAIQVDFDTKPFQFDYAIITNVDPKQFKAREIYTYDGPVFYFGNIAGTTRLGEHVSRPTYEVISVPVKKLADELLIMILRKRLTVEAQKPTSKETP